ncbi:MAG: Xaa-Pro peptidase family protein [Candidatus Promineifilaceae bacterium]|nr:Xaa-Pro peptidase family protein [Candidatus Promineifilaceae bacterium]
MNEKRLQKLIQGARARGLDGVALVPGANMAYISGIHAHLSERPMVLFIPVNDEPAIVIPVLEASKAQEAGVPLDRIFAWSDEEGYTHAFDEVCAQLNLSEYLLGVEALRMRVLELELLQRYAPGLRTTHAEPVLDTLRMQKDADEIAAHEKAVRLAEESMRELLPRLHAGLTEKEVAAMFVRALLASGADGLAFPPIVSSGPNGASPHAVPTDRPLQNGDLLVIDWGVVVDGYISDITRTFAVGTVDEELRLIYDVVQAANEAGRAAARPGASGADIDRAARRVIENAGYGDYFIHRTGHGLGLETHENPQIVQGNDAPLAPGTVFTVEPGIYLPGRGGVRIEDNLVITEEGGRSLTSFPRHLQKIEA